jgi:hypothetical protein
MRGYASRVGGLFSPFGEAVLLRPEEYILLGEGRREKIIVLLSRLPPSGGGSGPLGSDDGVTDGRTA